MLVKILILIVCLGTPIWATSTLISVVQVFRHGQRTPIAHYPNDPYSDSSYWPVAEGQLTNVGKTQHHNLGKFTRDRYNDYLPAAYTNEIIYAQTTDIDRTHMSAQCNLLGLFPPTSTELWNPDVAWSPIPVHPSDPNIISTYLPCSAHATEVSRVLKEDPYFQNIDSTYSETYEYLTTHSGTNVTSLSDIVLIFDSLLIENEFGYALPSWTEAVFPEPLTTLAGYFYQSYGYNTKLARLSAGTFLNEVIEHFETMEANSTSAQFFRMYSAHDANLAEILLGLGAFKPHAPYFANSIYFELRKSFLGSYYVNIYYRNKGVLEKITPSGCLQFDCNLSNLKNHLSDVLIDPDTWIKECTA